MVVVLVLLVVVVLVAAVVAAGVLLLPHNCRDSDGFCLGFRFLFKLPALHWLERMSNGFSQDISVCSAYYGTPHNSLVVPIW